MRKGWVNRDHTRLLREASHGADVVRTLSLRTEVEVLEELERFFTVRLRSEYADLIGYVYADLLDVEPEDPPAPDPKYDYLLPCPRCGTKNWDVFPLQQSGHGLSSQSYFISMGFLEAAEVGARVCLRCGYLELCVEEDSLEDLRQLSLERGRKEG